jgi:NTP pyrophosphatase (non-canonical NTP hydrolase)
MKDRMELAHLIDTFPPKLRDDLRGRSALNAVQWLAEQLQLRSSHYAGPSLDSYQRDANRTNATADLANKALGLCGEAGEVAELVKKHLYHGHPLDKEKLRNELGDVLWYVATMASDFGIPLSDVASANVDKLRRRYPDGFSVERSLNRDGGAL